MFKTFCIPALCLFIFGCAPGTTSLSTPEPLATAQTIPIAQGIHVIEATPQQCAAGGRVYLVFNDEDRNGALDSNDTVLSEQVVCNGKNGTDGANGHSLVFHTVPAPAEVCAAGGYTLLMSVDIADSGVYDFSNPNQQSLTLCNGQSAPVAAYSPVEPIIPCGETVPFKEILLRLHNGQVLGSFSEDTGGTMTRLAFLPDGTFMNTDGSSCVFTLATSPNGKMRSISWNNQVQHTWAMLP